jgi:hypothetical protein
MSPPEPGPEVPASSRYVVVGAGVHGLSTAWHLARLLRDRGSGASSSQGALRSSVGARAVKGDEVIFLPPGAGRSYDVAPMRRVFKADGVETDVPVTLVEQPLEAVVYGAGRCVESYDDLKVMFMGGRI